MSEGLLLLAKVLGWAALAAALLLGVRNCGCVMREEGRMEVRAEWIAADNQRKAEERKALIDRQRNEREDEQRMARAAEEKDREQTHRENVLRRRADAAERTADGLRGTIARLNADSRDRRAEGTCAAAEREADAAATARGLLGTCSVRYRELAADAGGLASQVIGLQDHVVVVQPQAAALIEDARP